MSGCGELTFCNDQIYSTGITLMNEELIMISQYSFIPSDYPNAQFVLLTMVIYYISSHNVLRMVYS